MKINENPEMRIVIFHGHENKIYVIFITNGTYVKKIPGSPAQ